jgi:hypothetical protein
MSDFPWRAAICISVAALTSPLLAGAIAVAASDSWLLEVAFLWFFALPIAAYELGVPTDEGTAIVTVLYALQYLMIWRVIAAILLVMKRPLRAVA